MIVLAFVALAATSNAQWFDLGENNNRFTLGLNLGSAGFGTDQARFGMGAGLSIWGVYVDFIWASPQNRYNNHVVQEYWDDDEAFAVNICYQIPVLPWLRVAPIIGYCQTNYGYVDASTVNVEVDSETSTGRIYHDYYPLPGSIMEYFNYGGGVFVQPFEWLGFHAVASRRAIYGGVTIDLSAMRD